MKKSLKKWLAPVIVAAVAIVAVIVLFATGILGGNTIKVPDVLNMNAEEAQKILEEAGLSLCISDRIVDDSVDENTVLKQSPESGEKIEKGGTVNITVSEKSVEVTIPDVENFDKELAIDALQNAGFNVEIVEEESDEFADGTVISQSHSGKGQTGTTITITVSKNDNVSSGKLIKVPSVVGKTPEEARKLFGGKLYLKITEEKFSSSVKKGAIISQSPEAEKETKEYSTIEVVVSRGKASETEIIMPDVVFASRAEAKNTLEKLGLSVTVKEKYSDKVSAGIVISQSIPKGKKITADATVTIVVSAGKQPEITTIRPGDLPTQVTTSLKNETTTKKDDSQNVTQKPTNKPTVPATKPTEPSGESKYIADFAITTDKSQAKAGDTITVSVKLKTNYNIVAISLPVIYDAYAFELVGTSENNLSSYLNFTGTLKDNGYTTNGNWKSPDSMYTKNSNKDHWTSSLTKARYKIAFATWVAAPSQGTVITKLDKEETIVTFKLKVKENVSDTSGRIFLSQDFIKTAKDPQGILSVGRTTSDKITTDSIVSTGQTIDLRDATVLVTIK